MRLISAESGMESLDAVILPCLKKCFRITYSKNFKDNFSVNRVISWIFFSRLISRWILSFNKFFFQCWSFICYEIFDTKISLYLRRFFLIIFNYFLYIYMYNISREDVKCPKKFFENCYFFYLKHIVYSNSSFPFFLKKKER